MSGAYPIPSPSSAGSPRSPSISAPYLVNALAHGGPRERETATSLLRLLAGPRVIVPLRDVLRDRGLSDEARVSAAMVLEGLGEPVDIGGLTAELSDAKGLFESVWDAVIEGSQDESFLESLLQSMESAPTAERDDLIRSLAEPGDTRALQLLQPLLHSKRVGAVIAAIDAIDLLGGTSALPALQELAEGDPSAKIRQRARVAYGRLHMRSHSFLSGSGPDRPRDLAGAAPAIAIPFLGNPGGCPRPASRGGGLPPG